MQGPVPHIVKGLIEPARGIFIEINEHHFVRVEGGTPDERQVVAQPRERLGERVVKMREAGRSRQDEADKN